MPNIHWFQLLKCEYLMLFLSYTIVNWKSLGLRLLGIILDFGNCDHCFLTFNRQNDKSIMTIIVSCSPVLVPVLPWRTKQIWLQKGLQVKQSLSNLKAALKSDKKCVISDHRWSTLLCLEMLDRALSAVFDGLMNSRPACQDKVPRLAEHTGADQIPIRESLVSVAWSEPGGQVFLCHFLCMCHSNLTSLITSVWSYNV